MINATAFMTFDAEKFDFFSEYRANYDETSGRLELVIRGVGLTSVTDTLR